MGLVENHATPGAGEERGAHQFLVIAYKHLWPHLDKVTRDASSAQFHPCIALDGVDTHPSPLQHAYPGIQHGERRHEQCLFDRPIHHRRGDLNRLAEPHIVALESAADHDIVHDGSDFFLV